MQNSSKEEELSRLLELKLIPDNQRSNKQQLEMQKLQEQHKSYAQLNAKDMQKKLHHKPDSLALAIQSPTNALINQDYENKFANKPGYKKPSQQNNIQTITFGNEQDASDFLQSQASKGRNFKVLDAQNNVLAVSNGKGMLQHADGRPLNAGLASINPANTTSNPNNSMQNSNMQNSNNPENRNNPMNQTLLLQKGTLPRPLMTRPGSTMLPNPRAALSNGKLPGVGAVPPVPAGQKTSPNQEAAPRSPYAILTTPLKKTPYDK